MNLLNTFLRIGALLLLLAGCVTTSQSPEDAVDRVANHFHVPRERVIEVAEALDVDPDEIETFGSSYFFPYNYYEYQFQRFEEEHGRPPTRSEVEQMVKGYIAKCVSGGGGIYYVYYSTHTHPKWHDPEVAMVFGIAFYAPHLNEPEVEDPPFEYMQIINLQDASVNPPDETYWDRCIQEYLQGEQADEP